MCTISLRLAFSAIVWIQLLAFGSPAVKDSWNTFDAKWTPKEFFFNPKTDLFFEFFKKKGDEHENRVIVIKSELPRNGLAEATGEKCPEKLTQENYKQSLTVGYEASQNCELMLHQHLLEAKTDKPTMNIALKGIISDADLPTANPEGGLPSPEQKPQTEEANLSFWSLNQVKPIIIYTHDLNVSSSGNRSKFQEFPLDDYNVISFDWTKRAGPLHSTGKHRVPIVTQCFRAQHPSLT